MKTNERIEALAEFLEIEKDGMDDITETRHTENCFEYGRDEYLVLTDEEADEAVKESIKDSLWAFNADFICNVCDLPSELEDGIRAAQEKQCESANDWILRLVEKQCGIDRFVEQAVSADGRGHFLSSYDGEENEVAVEKDGQKEYLYIYRR